MPILVDPSLATGLQVDLCGVWFNDAADLADVMAFDRWTDLSPQVDMTADVRTNASGRRRLFKTAGGLAARTYPMKLGWCSREQVTWLESKVGQLLCVRDSRGRKFYGSYTSVQVSETFTDRNRADVALSVLEVTHSEAV